MKAVVYEGPQVSVKDVPDARIERPTDVRCGSRRRTSAARPAMYEGGPISRPAAGSGTRTWARWSRSATGSTRSGGDYVVLPFNIACITCKNCERQLTNYCLTAQPKKEGGGGVRLRRHGSVRRGTGGTAARALGRLQLPAAGEDAEERQTDYVMLADIFPTGYHATEMAGEARRPDGHLRSRTGRADGRLSATIRGPAR